TTLARSALSFVGGRFVRRVVVVLFVPCFLMVVRFRVRFGSGRRLFSRGRGCFFFYRQFTGRAPLRKLPKISRGLAGDGFRPLPYFFVWHKSNLWLLRRKCGR